MLVPRRGLLDVMLGALPIFGSAAGGIVVGYLAALRAGLPFGRSVALPACCIAGLAVPYLLLVAIMADAGAAGAAALGVLAGVALACGFRLRVAKAMGGRFHA